MALTRKAKASSRPFRVAHLIDPSKCPPALLDAVFREAFGRWGGRRTLLVAATEDGVDSRYSKFLRGFDPDIVYSYVDLTDNAVADIHEQYGPAYLVRHHTLGIGGHREEYSVRLPVNSLSAISTLPALIASSRLGFDPPKEFRVVDKHPSQVIDEFLAENFGFISDAFLSLPFVHSFPDIFKIASLISEETFNDSRIKKYATCQYAFSEDVLLDRMTTGSGVISASQLSELFAPYMDYGVDWTHSGVTVVVGDTIDDRWLYWNSHHSYRATQFAQLTTLRVSQARASDPEFMGLVKRIIWRRAGSGKTIILRSCSASAEELKAYADTMRAQKPSIPVIPDLAKDHSACIPKILADELPQLVHGSIFFGYDTEETTEFESERALVPASVPWHLRVADAPSSLREGYWCLDVNLERLDDHSPYSNVAHSWVIPRRLRLERGFQLHAPPEKGGANLHNFIRVNSDGLLSIARWDGQRDTFLQIPTDIGAFTAALCGGYEWYPFDRSRSGAPIGRVRYANAEVAENGRYLLGILERFERLNHTFGVLMNGYWSNILRILGGVPVEKSPHLAERFIKVMRRRFGVQTGALTFESAEDLDRLARESLRIARQMPRARESIGYSELKERWLVWRRDAPDIRAAIQKGVSSEEALSRLCTEELDPALQFICAHDLLYQGLPWTCRGCGNHNWVSIDGTARSLTCDVCRRTVAAPVSGDWHFRPDSFVIDAYRDHGIEPVIWTLWTLWRRARRSFFFAPSLSLWENRYEGKRDAELDILAAVDGGLYLCEAKNGDALTRDERERLIRIAKRVRPDVVLLALMGGSGSLGKLKDQLETELSSFCRVEVMSFTPSDLRAGEPLLH